MATAAHPHVPVIAAPEDKALANVLAVAVQAAGARPCRLFSQMNFRSENIPLSLRSVIDDSLFVLVVVSRDTENSPQALALIKYAFSKKKALLPYKIHPEKPGGGLSIMLASSHWLDVSLRNRPEDGIPELQQVTETHLNVHAQALRQRERHRMQAALCGIGVGVVLIAALALTVTSLRESAYDSETEASEETSETTFIVSADGNVVNVAVADGNVAIIPTKTATPPKTGTATEAETAMPPDEPEKNLPPEIRILANRYPLRAFDLTKIKRTPQLKWLRAALQRTEVNPDASFSFDEDTPIGHFRFRGGNILHLLAARTDPALTQTLRKKIAAQALAAGTPLTRKTTESLTPFAVACFFNSDFARFLVEAGANPGDDDVSPPKMRPPAIAARWADAELLRTVFSTPDANGKLPDAGENLAAGVRPLHAAACEGQHENVEFLLEKGADAKITDDRGATPLHCLLAERQLRKKDGAYPLWAPARQNAAETARKLVAAGTDVNAVCAVVASESAQTALGEESESRVLMPTFPRDGRSALHIAAAGGDVQMVKLLLELGADPNLKNARWETPLQFMRKAAWKQAGEEEKKEIAKLLGEKEEPSSKPQPAKAKPAETPAPQTIWHKKLSTAEAQEKEFREKRSEIARAREQLLALYPNLKKAPPKWFGDASDEECAAVLKFRNFSSFAQPRGEELVSGESEKLYALEKLKETDDYRSLPEVWRRLIDGNVGNFKITRSRGETAFDCRPAGARNFDDAIRRGLNVEIRRADDEIREDVVYFSSAALEIRRRGNGLSVRPTNAEHMLGWINPPRKTEAANPKTGAPYVSVPQREFRTLPPRDRQYVRLLVEVANENIRHLGGTPTPAFSPQENYWGKMLLTLGLAKKSAGQTRPFPAKFNARLADVVSGGNAEKFEIQKRLGFPVFDPEKTILPGVRLGEWTPDGDTEGAAFENGNVSVLFPYARWTNFPYDQYFRDAQSSVRDMRKALAAEADRFGKSSPLHRAVRAVGQACEPYFTNMENALDAYFRTKIPPRTLLDPQPLTRLAGTATPPASAQPAQTVPAQTRNAEKEPAGTQQKRQSGGNPYTRGR